MSLFPAWISRKSNNYKGLRRKEIPCCGKMRQIEDVIRRKSNKCIIRGVITYSFFVFFYISFRISAACVLLCNTAMLSSCFATSLFINLRINTAELVFCSVPDNSNAFACISHRRRPSLSICKGLPSHFASECGKCSILHRIQVSRYWM